MKGGETKKMKWKRMTGGALLIAAAGAVALLLGSCSPGPISYGEAEELVSRVEDLRDRVEQVENELAELRSGQEEELTTTAGEKVDFAQQELSQVVTRLDEIAEVLAPPEPPAETQQPQPGQPGQPGQQPGQPGQPAP